MGGSIIEDSESREKEDESNADIRELRLDDDSIRWSRLDDLRDDKF